MIDALSKKIGNSVPIAWKDSDLDYFYNAVYLSCLLLFGKPGYMDAPAAEHFALPQAADFMKSVDYRPVKETERGKLQALREQYGNIQGLTNPEIHFVIDLFDRSRK
jgi:hypothetical protein